MKTYKLHLIRHGLTQGNIDGLYVGGGLDMPLTEEGKAQLREMKQRYRYPGVGVVFASPMQRALQSADILYPEVAERLVLEDLREYRFGEFEGKSVAEMMKNERHGLLLSPESDFVPEGGESGVQFAQRTARAMQTMLEHQAKNNISQAACVAHGGVIFSMMVQMALPKRPFYEWMSDNGAGFTVQSSAAMIMRDGIVEAVGVLPEGYVSSR